MSHRSQSSFVVAVACLISFMGLCDVSAQTAGPSPQIVRHVVVQGSVGKAGREIAFVNLQNLEEHVIHAVVELRGTGLLLQQPYVLAGMERRPLNVADEFPELNGHGDFSVVVYFADAQYDFGGDVAAAAVVTWLRASDLAQVDSVTAVTRSSTKR